MNSISARTKRFAFNLTPLRVAMAFALVFMAGTALNTSTAGATTEPATITLSGYTTPGEGSTYIVILDAPVDITPTGAATVSDNLGHQCEASAWTDDGSDGSTGELFNANCNITGSEPAGTTATATYSGTDYSASVSNTVIIADAMSMSGTLPAPHNSDYVSTATITLGVPHGDLAPTGSAEASDGNGDSCAGSVWSGPAEQNGVDVYTTSCVITSAGSYQGYVTSLYDGTDYLASGGSYSTQLFMFGDEALSNTTYGIAAYAPSGSPAPTGTVTVLDSEGGHCTASNWTNEGSDGFSSTLYETSCGIPGLEPGGLSVAATYNGSDYSYGASNQLITASSLTIVATPYVSAGGGNYSDTVTATLGLPHGMAGPTGAVTVSSTNSTCVSGTSWLGPTEVNGTDFYTNSCQQSSSIPDIGLVLALYTGSDYGAELGYYAEVSTTLSGSAQPYGTDNGYGLTLVSPIDRFPTGQVTVTDSAGGSCTSSGGWGYFGPNGSGGWLFSNGCQITTEEVPGVTVQATYSGGDYTAPASNVMLVGGPPPGGGGGGSTSPTPPVTTTPTTPTAPAPTPSISIPTPREVTYDANSRALSATAKNVLSALAKKLVKGGSVTVVGYAHDDATLARKRAEVVASYLAAKVAVHVSIKIVTTSTVNKVMVITTRQ